MDFKICFWISRISKFQTECEFRILMNFWNKPYHVIESYWASIFLGNEENDDESKEQKRAKISMESDLTCFDGKVDIFMPCLWLEWIWPIGAHWFTDCVCLCPPKWRIQRNNALILTCHFLTKKENKWSMNREHLAIFVPFPFLCRGFPWSP